jgi:hypothetical protein
MMLFVQKWLKQGVKNDALPDFFQVEHFHLFTQSHSDVTGWTDIRADVASDTP